MWDTVLFDLDGTLTDSGEGITKSAQYALEKEFGITYGRRGNTGDQGLQRALHGYRDL